MTSLAGCSGDNFASILRSLGYVALHREGPPITTPLLPKAATEPLAPHSSDAAPADAETPVAAVPAREANDGDGVSIEAATDWSESADAETAPPEAPAAIEASAPEEALAIPAPVEASTPDELLGDAASAEAPAASGDDFTAAPAEPPVFGLEAGVGADERAASAPTDANSAAVPDEPGSDPAVPAPPVLIEIWRPHRQQHHARRAEPHAGRQFEPRERTKGAAEPDAAPRPKLSGAADASARQAPIAAKRTGTPGNRGSRRGRQRAVSRWRRRPPRGRRKRARRPARAAAAGTIATPV